MQNIFLIDDGDSIKGELERRKFTAEEGDHLTALNAYNAFVKCALRRFFDTHLLLTVSRRRTQIFKVVPHRAHSFSILHACMLTDVRAPAQHRLNFKALSRALSIRTQLRKYLQRSAAAVLCGPFWLAGGGGLGDARL